MILSRDEILAAKNPEPQTLEVPEWGGSVLVRRMSAGDRDAWNLSLLNEAGGAKEIRPANLTARFVAYVLVDTDGKRLFSETDAAALGEKDSQVMDRVYKVAQQVNGMTPEATADAVKNSETAPSDASPIA